MLLIWPLHRWSYCFEGMLVQYAVRAYLVDVLGFWHFHAWPGASLRPACWLFGWYNGEKVDAMAWTIWQLG